MTITSIKKIWSQAVINKNIKDILNLYSSKAIFKGTLMVDAVKDKKEIKKYFENFSPTVNDIKFLPNEVIVKCDNNISEIGFYKFYTAGGIIKAQYNFVYCINKKKEIKIISHFSTIF